jgi:D-3-phosphoglycerate dehydrogenase
MHNIHCLNSISKVGLSTLKNTYQLTDQIEDAEAILVRSFQMHDLVLNKKTLAVARAGAGVNNIPVDVYGKQGMVCFNTPGANANAVKELTILGMLLASRDVFGGMTWLQTQKENQEVHKTVEKEKAKFGGTEISGKTIGIIGLGAIGEKLALSCHALGMKVIATKRNLSSIDLNMFPKDIEFVKSAELIYKKADFISLNLPLNQDTKHMIQKDTLSLMKEGVIILNFARAELVSDKDLLEAIESKKVRAYVTDFPTYQTLNMPQVINIPHLGASTEEAEDVCASMAAHQLMGFIEFGDIKNSVNYPDVTLGEKKGKHRVLIMYDGNMKLLETLQPYFAKMHVKNVIDRQNKQFGYLAIDIDDTIRPEMKSCLEDMEGIYRIRVI